MQETANINWSFLFKFTRLRLQFLGLSADGGGGNIPSSGGSSGVPMFR